MKYIVDIDGTICTWEKDGRYENAQPFKERIEVINRLYDDGHQIHYWTARGANSKRDLYDLTESQLKEWGVKYHSLRCDKPAYDIWIDDKAISDKGYFGFDFENEVTNRS